MGLSYNMSWSFPLNLRPFVWIWTSDFLNHDAKFYIYPHFILLISSHVFTLLKFWISILSSKVPVFPPLFGTCFCLCSRIWFFQWKSIAMMEPGFLCFWLWLVLQDHMSFGEITGCDHTWSYTSMVSHSVDLWSCPPLSHLLWAY